MGLPLVEIQAVNNIAKLLYDFLPGQAHPYADQSISFEGIARKCGLQPLWTGGSKLPAITTLLEKTLELRREQFCNLVLEIVRRGMQYRSNKGKPITREEIESLNNLIAQVHFKIPELWDKSFLNSLPSMKKHAEEPNVDLISLDNLKQALVKLTSLTPQTRGFALEKFLQELFAFFDLAPRGSFRLVGEQIDGSFQIGTDVYLVEAKWHEKLTAQSDLLVFREKVESKSAWSRGLFISYNGFTADGLEAFSQGRSTNIIGMTSQDIYFILDGKIPLADAINRKARRAAETGEFFVSILELLQ